MTAGLPSEVLADLATTGPKCVYHVSRASSLPDIVASGGLLSASQRRVAHRHPWGHNSDLGADLVCCSLRPHWGIQNTQFPDAESVILMLDAVAVGRLPGARLCPQNSATQRARPYLEAQLDESNLLERCRADKASAELLIPLFVPFELVRFVMFCDREAKDVWWPVVEEALGTTGADNRVTVLVDGDLERVGFAPTLHITQRVRPPAVGLDQRLRPIEADIEVDDLSEISVEDLEREFAEDEELVGEDGDLFDLLYGHRRAERPRTDFVGWPVDDDEPLDDTETF